MEGTWAPVALAAIIVFGVVGGVVGGQIVHTLLKRVLPLLEEMARNQAGGSRGELKQLGARVSELAERTARLDATVRRVDRLEEEISFLQSLLEEGTSRDRLPLGGDAEK